MYILQVAWLTSASNCVHAFSTFLQHPQRLPYTSDTSGLLAANFLLASNLGLLSLQLEKRKAGGTLLPLLTLSVLLP